MSKPVEKPQPKWAELTKLAASAPAELFTFAKAAVKQAVAIETAQAEFTGQIQFHAKCVAALKIAHRADVDARRISPSTSFKDYFKANCGGDLPGRVEAVANVFNELVETGNLTEEAFDAAAVDWLEKASAVINHARKENAKDYLASEAVQKVCKAIGSPGDALKTIKAVRKEQTDAAKAAKAPATAAPAESSNTFSLGTTDGLLKGICLIGAELRSFADAKRVHEVLEAMRIAGEMMEANPLVAAYFAAEVAKADAAAHGHEKPATVTEVKTSRRESGVAVFMPAVAA